MERISIFNYEVFYLDHLEGNLSEAETSMLMQFLEEHPECRLEEEEFIALEPEEAIVYGNKQQLKQVADTDAISLANVEHFMIAEAEGTLTNSKIDELNAFVVGNEYLEAARLRYAAVYFEADPALVYTDKKALKRRATIVLWPYVSGAVAAAVIAFVMLSNFGQFQVLDTNVSWDNFKLEVPNLGVTNGTGPTETPMVKPKPTNSLAAYSEKGIIRKKRVSDAIDQIKLKTRPMELMQTSFDKETLMPVTQLDPANFRKDPSVATNSEVNSKENDPGRTTLAMSNPIAPITNFINKKSSTDVDFGQRKPSTTKKGGFYVKIGKFELSRNKH